MRPFFIISQYRVGSELLCSLYQSHPEIVCPHESLRDTHWFEIGNALARTYPLAYHIGLHGQFDQITSDIWDTPYPKVILYRDDEVQGTVKQTLMDVRRVHEGFDLDVGVFQKNYLMRQERNNELFSKNAMFIKYEWLTDGENVDLLSVWKSQHLLCAINAPYYAQLKAGTVKEKPMLPRNMQELYNNVPQPVI